MKRRKPNPTKRAAKSGETDRKPGVNEPASSETAAKEPVVTASGQDGPSGPGPQLKAFLACFLAFHFLALLVTFASVIEPSELHAAIDEKLSLYLQNANFSTDERPVYLASGSSTEQPFRFQSTTVDPHLDASILEAGLEDERWTTIAPPGPAGGLGNDWYARWLKNATILAEAQSSGAVAELLLSKVPDDESVKAIRIVRLPTELTTAEEDLRPAPYTAFVSRHDGKVALVQAVKSRLATQKRGAKIDE